MKRTLGRLVVVAALTAVCSQAAAATPEELLGTLKAVGREGKGNRQATRALRELSRSNAKVLPIILRGFSDASPLAVNWIRSAFESIADREIKRGGKLPVAEIETFILDRSENPRARRLAFEWLAKVDKTAGDRIIPGMLKDPSSEFRRDAVARLIEQAQRHENVKQSEQAIVVYKRALEGAVHEDQVKAIAGVLKNLGQEVDLQKHFGFLTQWQLIGPFDNRGKKGFAVAYPPEKELKFKAKYKGQLGDVRWTRLSTKDDFGILDIAKDIKNYKGSVMYAATEFTSAKLQTVEIRLGTPNAWKLWVNGKQLFAREEYHRGMAVDQYRVEATLKPGRNLVLLKICQNEQTDSWAQRYQFQLRVCDGAGSAILSHANLNTTQLDNTNPRTLTVQGVK